MEKCLLEVKVDMDDGVKKIIKKYEDRKEIKNGTMQTTKNK